MRNMAWFLPLGADLIIILCFVNPLFLIFKLLLTILKNAICLKLVLVN